MRDITQDILSGRAEGIQTEEPEVKVQEQPEEQLELQEAEEIEDTPEQVDSIPEEQIKSPNWKELRRQAEEGKKAAKERDEAVRLLQMIYQNQQQPQKQTQKQEDDDFDINSLPDEDYSSNDVLKKVIKSQHKKYNSLKEEIETYKKQSYQSTIEHRIRSEFPDYQKIVSDENLERLKYERPSIFKSLSYNPDLYEQAVGVYEAIRDLGIYKPDMYSREEMQMAKNKDKPKSSQTIAPKKKDSPLNKIDSYGNPTQKEMDELYEDTKRKAGWGIYG